MNMVRKRHRLPGVPRPPGAGFLAVLVVALISYVALAALSDAVVSPLCCPSR